MSAPDLTPLFDPKGVLVAGASTHPGKFGFVVLHNILACGYRGNVFATNLEGDERARRPTVAATPPTCPTARSTSCSSARPRPRTSSSSAPSAAKGARAAFVTSAGYGETGEEGRRLEQELVGASPPSSAWCSPAPTARASCPRRLRCARRSSPPTRRPAGSASPASPATSCRASRTSPASRASE